MTRSPSPTPDDRNAEPLSVLRATFWTVDLAMDESTLAQADFWVSLIGSAATLLALIVAIVLGLHEVRRFRLEGEERRREEREQEVKTHEREAARRRAQAERVSARISVHPNPQHGRNEGGETVLLYGATADVVNASDLPIYEAKVAVAHGDVLHVSSVGFIPGREAGHTHFRPQLSRDLDRQPVEVGFRDAAGRWWYRCPEGHLSEELRDPFPREGDVDIQHAHPR
jgi:hypothetical protein